MSAPCSFQRNLSWPALWPHRWGGAPVACGAWCLLHPQQPHKADPVLLCLRFSPTLTSKCSFPRIDRKRDRACQRKVCPLVPWQPCLWVWGRPGAASAHWQLHRPQQQVRDHLWEAGKRPSGTEYSGEKQIRLSWVHNKRGEVENTVCDIN